MEEEVKLRTNNVGSVLQTLTNILAQDLPKKVKRTVQPVLIVNPIPSPVCNVAAGIDAGGGIYTTPTDKDFYLVAAQVSASDNTGAIAATELLVTIGGVAIPILTVYAGGSVTADSNAASINPAYPIKLDRGSAVTLTVNTANGSGSIMGFTVDTEFYDSQELH